MTMRRTVCGLLWYLGVLAAPSAATAQEAEAADSANARQVESSVDDGTSSGEPKPNETLAESILAEFFLGYQYSESEGSPIKVGEFVPLEPGPRVQAEFLLDWQRYLASIRASYRGTREQALSARAEMAGVVRADAELSKHTHRLEHDPLTNVGFDDGGVLDVSDADPNRDYEIERTQTKYTVRGHIPSMLGVDQIEVEASYRYLQRQGHDQARTISHCGACHVNADTRAINQRTDDISVGFGARVFDSLSIAYRHRFRKLEERADAPTWDYPAAPLDAQQLLPISGPAPFGSVSDTSKVVDRISAHWKGPHTLRLSSLYALSSARNDETGSRVKAHLAVMRATASPLTRLRTTLRYRYSSVLPSVAESISREHHELGLDLRYSPVSSLSLSTGYRWLSLMRNHVIVDRVSTAEDYPDADDYFINVLDSQMMERHRANLGLNARLPWRVRARLSYSFTSTQNPLSTIGRQGSFAPGSGSSPQPDTAGIYPTLSRLPEKVHEVRAELRCSPTHGLSIKPIYSLRKAESELASREWANHSVGIHAAYVPTTWLQLNAAHYRRHNEINTELYYGQVGGLRSQDEGWVDIAPNTLYAARSQNSYASITWSLLYDVRLRAMAALSRSDARFDSDGATEHIGPLSAESSDTRTFSASIDWALLDAWALTGSYDFSEYIQRPSGRHDGRSHTLWATLAWSLGTTRGEFDD